MSWSREFWAVELTGGLPGDPPMLIGTTWMRPAPKAQYEGEPQRAILFQTRQQAREWCRDKQAEYAGRKDYCADWKFKAVKVVETVKLKT